jgi:hypothetical protein
MKYVLFIIAILIGIYTILQTSQEKDIYSIKLGFENNKTIICDNIKISKDKFNLVSGTNVFLGRRDSNYKDYIFSLDRCVVGK